MKYSVLFGLFAAAALAVATLSGCTPEGMGGDEPQEAELRVVTIGTLFEGAATKAEIGDDLKFSWTPGDEIAVYAGDQYYTSLPYHSANQFSVALSGTRTNYAVYPAVCADNNAATVENLKVTLPDSYDLAGKDNFFSPLPMIAVNREGADLAFKHLGGLLRLTVENVPDNATTLKVDLGRRITGSFDVLYPDVEGGSLIQTDNATTGTYVSFTNFTRDANSKVVLNIPIPVGTYSGVTVTALDANGEISSVSELFAHEWSCARKRGKQFDAEIATFSLAVTLQVADWADGGTTTIDYQDAAHARSFSFHDDTHPTYPSSGVTINMSAWNVTFNSLTGVFYLSFSIDSPNGASWSVQMEDPSGYFLLYAMDGDTPVAPRGTVVANQTITLQLRPNPSNIPSSRSEAYSMVLHTFVEVGENAYNVDSETQLFNVYDKLAEFIIPANQ